MNQILLATASYDRTIRFWDANTARCIRAFQHKESQVNKLELSPDLTYVAAAGNPQIKFFDINGNSQSAVLSFTGHTNNITSLGFQKQGKWMYSASEDQTVKLWDLSQSGCAREFKYYKSVTSAALHPNQAELIVGLQNGYVSIIDLTAGKVSQQMQLDESSILSISVSPDGTTFCAATNIGMCYIYEMPQSDASSLILKKKFKAHSEYILSCKFSPNSSLLATTSSDETIKLWNTSTWTEEKKLVGHQQWVWDCAFSGDSSYILTGASDKTSRLWDISQGETVRQYQGHTKSVCCVALNDAFETNTNESNTNF